MTLGYRSEGRRGTGEGVYGLRKAAEARSRSSIARTRRPPFSWTSRLAQSSTCRAVTFRHSGRTTTRSPWLNRSPFWPRRAALKMNGENGCLLPAFTFLAFLWERVKMHYFVWDPARDNSIYKVSRIEGLWETPGLYTGNPIDNWNKECVGVLLRDTGKSADCLAATSRKLFVSKRLSDYLKRHAKGEMQCLPLPIRDEMSIVVLEGYSVLNALENVDCVDLNATPHEIKHDDPGSPEGRIQLIDWEALIVLKKSVIGERKIFRIKRLLSHLVVREDLAQDMKDQGFTGLSFSSIFKVL